MYKNITLIFRVGRKLVTLSEGSPEWNVYTPDVLLSALQWYFLGRVKIFLNKNSSPEETQILRSITNDVKIIVFIKWPD